MRTLLICQCAGQVPTKSSNTHAPGVQGAHHSPLSLAGSTGSSWTDSEIRVFLLEWEVVEQEMGHPGRKIHKKTRALCRRLYHRGLKKSWESCFDLLLSLRDLHRTLCNERPGIEPLFSPYAEALYRILGSSPQGSWFPGPLDSGAGNLPLSMYPQTPRNQPWDYGVGVPSTQLQGNALPMMSQEESLFPRGEHWYPSHSMSAPNLLPDFAPGDPNFQQPWPSSE